MADNQDNKYPNMFSSADLTIDQRVGLYMALLEASLVMGRAEIGLLGEAVADGKTTLKLDGILADFTDVRNRLLDVHIKLGESLFGAVSAEKRD